MFIKFTFNFSFGFFYNKSAFCNSISKEKECFSKYVRRKCHFKGLTYYSNMKSIEEICHLKNCYF